MGRHAAVAAGFVVLAVVWTLPLSLHLSTHLPGETIGDNAVFLWNFWWMRHAIATHTGFFHTTYLFAPVGTSLTFHTHTALPAFVGATLLGGLPLVAALNLVSLAAIALNGICAYALAWRTTNDRAAAIVAGVIFGCSPFVAAHLTGHFNLIHAWVIPLFVWAVGSRQSAVGRAVLAGVVLGTTAYIDYYFVVFEIGFAVCAYVMHSWRWAASDRPLRGMWQAAFVVLAALVAIDVVVIAIISMTGGFTWRIGSLEITSHSLFNPMQVLGLLIAAAACVYVRPSVRMVADPGVMALRAAAGTIGTFAVLAAPLALDAARMIANGDYASQQPYWRSAPAGIDLATLVLGNPFHGVWGSAVRESYASLGINAVESVAWIGIVPAALAILAVRRRAEDQVARQWLTIAVLFFIWSLGSHVIVGGRNTGLLAPSAVLQLVPVLANARMPGRAMVVVYLAIAMLAAIAVASSRARGRAAALSAVIVALVLLEFLAAPFPIAPVACAPIYETLRARPEQGAVLELPIGFGDGFGGVTPADNRRMLACQSVHERPLVGGFVARLPPQVLDAYRADPLLATLIRLSDGTDFEDVALPAHDEVTARMRADGIAFVLVNRAQASEALLRYVDTDLSLTKIAEHEAVTLFALTQ